MDYKIIKLVNGDLINLKYIIGKINVSDIRNYKKINSLLNKFNNGIITREEYNAGYEGIVKEAKNTLSNFKKNFIDLYICNIISKRENNKSIELSQNIYFDTIEKSLNFGLKNNSVPQNIIYNISKFDTNEIMKNTAKLNCRLSLRNCDSISSQMLIDVMNNKFNELKQKKTLVKK